MYRLWDTNYTEDIKREAIWNGGAMVLFTEEVLSVMEEANQRHASEMLKKDKEISELKKAIVILQHKLKDK